MKHTAGKWEYSEISSVVGSLISSNSVDICAVIPQKDKSITEANAKLIASAPELLEACKQALKFIRCGDNMKQDLLIPTETSIEQAIAKAEEGEK